jgi:hypothetical protein
VDSAGNVYVADARNCMIRKITPTGVVTTLAGRYGGSADGTGAEAEFSSASGVAVDGAGNVYVADYWNNTIRRGALAVGFPEIVTQPLSQVVPVGVNVTFTMAANDTEPLSYQWKKGATNLANGSNISGATSASLTLTNVQLADAGSYTATVTNAAGNVTSNAATLTVNDARLFAIACRAVVGAGDKVLIPGIIVSGSGPKQVIVRASGPALIPQGVTGTLAQPQLRLYSGSNVMAENIGWDSGSAADTQALRDAFKAVGLSQFPAGSADCALLATLSPGAYTAIVSGVNGTTGVALIEVYEMP